jgi:hypothetical protein
MRTFKLLRGYTESTLRAVWTPQVEEELQVYSHNVDLEDEMVRLLSEEMSREIDNEIINRITSRINGGNVRI